MSVRDIIEIDENKCDGCGDCVLSCAEGAIAIIDGKAKVVNETYCDGFGACLGECPQGAITMIKREAPAYDEEAVKIHLANLEKKKSEPLPLIDSSNQPTAAPSKLACGCPGSAMRQFDNNESTPTEVVPLSAMQISQLKHWPVQLMLVPPHAPFLKNAEILLCADCVPFAVPDFHSRYLAGKSLLVGCPKLDDLQYYFEKLKEIFKVANPKSVTVLKMEVPCCSGIAQAARQARDEIAPEMLVEVVTISIYGGARCDEGLKVVK